MSKSNATEIIGLLWLIAGLLATGWVSTLFWIFFTENLIESMYWSFKEHFRSKDE